MCVQLEHFNDHVMKNKKKIDQIRKDISLKSNITDVCTIFDGKANIDAENEAL